VTADAVHGSGICLYAHMFELATGIRTTADSPRPGRAKPRANVDRLQATPSDARNVTGGQGVAGSNPAVPTGNLIFSKIFTPRKSQQRSQLVVQRPLHRPAPCACHGAPPGHLPRQQTRQAHQSKRQRSLSHPGPALRPRTPSPAHPLTAGQTLTGVPQLQDAGKPGCSNQACPRRRRREAAGIRAAPRTGRRDRSDLHRRLETRPHPRHGETAVQVSSQCDAPANEFSDFKASGTAHAFPK
jgi:hypothetical protein